MKIEIKKCGDLLASHQAGREAYLALQSYSLNGLPKDELIEINFEGVKAITPSWADEVVTKIFQEFENVKLLNTENSTVQATLETPKEYSGLKI